MKNRHRVELFLEPVLPCSWASSLVGWPNCPKINQIARAGASTDLHTERVMHRYTTRRIGGHFPTFPHASSSF